jgi:hypothetical protein
MKQKTSKKTDELVREKKQAQKKSEEIVREMEGYRNDHSEWKSRNLKNKAGFFPVFNDFKSSHLSGISGGALKAYIYFGMHANNSSGESWHSNEKLSEFFEVDTRTVKKWVAELEERSLIRRIQVGFKRAANTFLIPYEAVVEEDDDEIDYEGISRDLKALRDLNN